MKKIAIVGAYDRYNYGDILFPIILTQYIKDNNLNYKIDYYALKKADLTNIGGVKTNSLSDLNYNEYDKIIVAGGDVLSVDIGSLYIDLSNNKYEMYIKKIIRKVFGSKSLNKIASKKLKIYNEFPWIIESKNVYYNAVGGTGINLLPKDMQTRITHNLQKSAYLSVRDKYSGKYTNCKNIYPDSAMILSDIIDEKSFKKNVNKELKKFINENKYIVFQINYKTFKNNKDIIIDQLSKISKEMKILLLPIGYAKDHDDLVSLKQINKTIKNSYLFENLNIYEITYIIKMTTCFIGTSLHGNIISMSYSVPHIGISKNILKLDGYLKSWEKTCKNECIPIEKIYEEYTLINKCDKSKLKNNTIELKKIVYKNLKVIFGEENE